MRSSRLSRFCSERTWWKTSARRRYDSTSGGTAPMYCARSASGSTAAETARRALTNGISAGLRGAQSRKCTRTGDTPFRDASSLVLAFPVAELFDAAHHADAAEEDLVRARVVDDLVRDAGAVGEQREPVVAG